MFRLRISQCRPQWGVLIDRRISPIGQVGQFLVLMACAGLLAGCAASSTNTNMSSSNPLAVAATENPGGFGYRVGAFDVLDVSVFKVPELSKTVQVAETGTINLPLVGEIPARGLTAQDIERSLTTKLEARYLQKPQVTVYVREYNSQRVTVEGAIKKPGVYPIRGRSSLLQLIATADGLDPKSDSTVIVMRVVDGKRSGAKFDIDRIRSGEAEDPIVQAGDTIVVGTSAIKSGFEHVLKALPAVGIFALLL